MNQQSPLRCVFGASLRPWLCVCTWLAAAALSAPAVAHEGHAALPSKGVTVDGEDILVSERTANALGMTTTEIVSADVRRAVRVHAKVELPWRQQQLVTTLVAGRVTAVGVRPGQSVQAGEVLAQLESLELESLAARPAAGPGRGESCARHASAAPAVGHLGRHRGQRAGGDRSGADSGAGAIARGAVQAPRGSAGIGTRRGTVGSHPDQEAAPAPARYPQSARWRRGRGRRARRPGGSADRLSVPHRRSWPRLAGSRSAGGRRWSSQARSKSRLRRKVVARSIVSRHPSSPARNHRSQDSHARGSCHRGRSRWAAASRNVRPSGDRAGRRQEARMSHRGSDRAPWTHLRASAAGAGQVPPPSR